MRLSFCVEKFYAETNNHLSFTIVKHNLLRKGTLSKIRLHITPLSVQTLKIEFCHGAIFLVSEKKVGIRSWLITDTLKLQYISRIVHMGPILLTIFPSHFKFDENFLLLSSKFLESDCCKILHMTQQPWCTGMCKSLLQYEGLAPVSLTRFRSNSKFDQNLECCSLKYVNPITTQFCTPHDSVTIVMCAKFCCDR